jgi:hypothetical protein
MSADTTLLIGTILGLLFYVFCTIVVIYVVWLLIKALRKYLRKEPNEKYR